MSICRWCLPDTREDSAAAGISPPSRRRRSQLFVQMLNRMGVETEQFADSTGQLDLRA